MKYWNKKRIILASLFSPLIISLVVALIVGHYFLYRYEDTITATLSPPQVFTNDSSNKEESNPGEKVSVDTVSERISSGGHSLSKKIVEEGSILVRNENNVLPFNKETETKVNVFGRGSVDWITCGSGSGQVDSEPDGQKILLLQALQRYGISYNLELERLYTSFCDTEINNSNVHRTNEFESLGQKYSSHKLPKNFYRMYEPSISDTKYFTDEVKDNAKKFSNIALVVINRRGGEVQDPTRVQYKGNQPTGDETRHYLQTSKEEDELLTWVGSNFEKVVVIINSTNTMELGFLESIPGIDSCLIVGATGNKGADAIPGILYGEVNPSGRTVDTYPYKFSYNINDKFSGGGIEGDSNSKNGTVKKYNDAVSTEIGGACYVDYVENVYLGYKWFETADIEGYWDNEEYRGYENVVQYPFGYGLSYTSFEWEVLKLDPEIGTSVQNNEKISAYIKVTNTGERAGKDVIEAYVTTPYKKGGIEKPYVSLIAVVKTPLIEPGNNTTVKIEVNTRDFESYDCYDKNENGFAGYELEAGDYQIKLMTNSHNVKKITLNSEKGKDAILTYKVNENIKIEKDELTGNKVENRFTGSKAEKGFSIDGSTTGENIEYISREKFPSIQDFKPKATRSMNESVKEYAIYRKNQDVSWDNAKTDIFGNTIPTKKPTFGKNSGKYKIFNGSDLTDLGKELASDYDSPKWDETLDSISLNEIVGESGILNSPAFSSSAISSVGKQKTNERDGPAQINSFNAGNNRGTGFPCATVLAQTYSTAVCYTYGLNYAKEMIAKGVHGAYAFGVNLHRSPFAGRNYEYMSEDGMLTGILASKIVRGLQNGGKFCYMKHLVLGETETGREGLYTWLTEQTFRELYLKPFQKVIEEPRCNIGMMSSYNRIGPLWTGGSEHLITGVLRYEWKFKGAVLTDYADHSYYMHGGQSYRAGGNLGMNTYFCGWTKKSNNDFSIPTANSSARILNRIREATKQTLFMNAYANYAFLRYREEGDEIEKAESLVIEGFESIIDDIFSIESKSLDSWVWWKPAYTSIEVVGFSGSALGLYFVFRPSPIKKAKAIINNPEEITAGSGNT